MKLRELTDQDRAAIEAIARAEARGDWQTVRDLLRRKQRADRTRETALDAACATCYHYAYERD